MISRLERDGRLLALLGTLAMLLAAGAAVGGLAGSVALAFLLAAPAAGLLVLVPLLVLRRVRFVADRVTLLHPGAVHAEPSPIVPVRVAPTEVLRRAVPQGAPHAGPSEDVTFERERNTLWWYAPGFGVGSGGHATILSMIAELERSGISSTIVLCDAEDDVPPPGYRTFLAANFPQVLARVVTQTQARKDHASGDRLIATDWRSVAAVLRDRGSLTAVYFVQDHEVEFTPTGTWSTLAAQTYRADLQIVTVSSSLSRLLNERYGVAGDAIPLPVDLEVYGVADGGLSSVVAEVRRANQDDLPIVVLYGRESTARRGVELAVAGLELAARGGLRFFCVVFGEDVELDDVAFPWLCVGVQRPRELAELYRIGHAGVVLSLTNPSLIPQEMLACGLPVLEAETSATREVFAGLPGCSLAPPHPEGIAATLTSMLTASARPDGPTASPRQQPTGLADPQQAASLLERALIGTSKPEGPVSLRSAPSVTIAIPTLDPDPAAFERLVAALDAQRYPGRVDVRIVDSGSEQPITDQLRGLRLPVDVGSTTRAAFRHGATRNGLIEGSDSDFIVFLTQDAVPIGERWLFDLVASCAADDRIGGAFCRHEPPQGAERVAAVSLREHFDRLDHVHSKPASPLNSPIENETLHASFFLSNNGSILRRTAWEQVPFPDVGFGEDQLWARDALRAGWSINYAWTSRVEHLNVFDRQGHEDRAAVGYAWNIKYWAHPATEQAALELMEVEMDDARRIVEAYVLTMGDYTVEVAAIRARAAGRRRAIEASRTGEGWYASL